MALNDFNKEERIAFEQILEGFQDALVMSKNVSTYKTDSVTMERTGDAIWRPQPYIATSFDGSDQSANFKGYTQLAVPATLSYHKVVPFLLDSRQLRDALQEKRLGDSAKEKIASDINVAVANVAALTGSLVVKRTTAAAGFDDVALCEAIMNEQGVQFNDRYLALSTRDYNGMASNLASRQTMQGKPVTAYERAFVGQVASFDTFKADYMPRIAAAAGSSITMSTLTAAGNYWVPKAVSVASTGERSNVDNRYQTITVSSTTGVAEGDCFTISGVNACHHITKGDTGQLKTFRVSKVLNSTTLVISAPIISGQGGSDAELAYQNVIVTPSASANIVFLNTSGGYLNPFWHKDAIELLPGRLAVPADTGTAVMRGSTDNGIELVFQKFYDIDTMNTKYRLDSLFGVVNKQPEMSGVILFGQA